MTKRITLPLTEDIIDGLRAGDEVLLNGPIYTGRDATHRRMVESLDQGRPLPIDIKGQTIYYCGPSPTPPGQPTGAAGPTTSGRMDAYTPRLLKEGLKGMIGKGMRSEEVVRALQDEKAVYFGALGGGGALIAKAIKTSQVIAYEELGAEALRHLEVEDMPVIVVNDAHGGDLYKQGRAAYRKA